MGSLDFSKLKRTSKNKKTRKSFDERAKKSMTAIFGGQVAKTTQPSSSVSTVKTKDYYEKQLEEVQSNKDMPEENKQRLTFHLKNMIKQAPETSSGHFEKQTVTVIGSYTNPEKPGLTKADVAMATLEKEDIKRRAAQVIDLRQREKEMQERYYKMEATTDPKEFERLEAEQKADLRNYKHKYNIYSDEWSKSGQKLSVAAGFLLPLQQRELETKYTPSQIAQYKSPYYTYMGQVETLEQPKAQPQEPELTPEQKAFQEREQKMYEREGRLQTAKEYLGLDLTKAEQDIGWLDTSEEARRTRGKVILSTMYDWAASPVVIGGRVAHYFDKEALETKGMSYDEIRERRGSDLIKLGKEMALSFDPTKVSGAVNIAGLALGGFSIAKGIKGGSLKISPPKSPNSLDILPPKLPTSTVKGAGLEFKPSASLIKEELIYAETPKGARLRVKGYGKTQIKTKPLQKPEDISYVSTIDLVEKQVPQRLMAKDIKLFEAKPETSYIVSKLTKGKKAEVSVERAPDLQVYLKPTTGDAIVVSRATPTAPRKVTLIESTKSKLGTTGTMNEFTLQGPKAELTGIGESSITKLRPREKLAGVIQVGEKEFKGTNIIGQRNIHMEEYPGTSGRIYSDMLSEKEFFWKFPEQLSDIKSYERYFGQRGFFDVGKQVKIIEPPKKFPVQEFELFKDANKRVKIYDIAMVKQPGYFEGVGKAGMKRGKSYLPKRVNELQPQERFESFLEDFGMIEKQMRRTEKPMKPFEMKLQTKTTMPKSKWEVAADMGIFPPKRPRGMIELGTRPTMEEFDIIGMESRQKTLLGRPQESKLTRLMGRKKPRYEYIEEEIYLPSGISKIATRGELSMVTRVGSRLKTPPKVRPMVGFPTKTTTLLDLQGKTKLRTTPLLSVRQNPYEITLPRQNIISRPVLVPKQTTSQIIIPSQKEFLIPKLGQETALKPNQIVGGFGYTPPVIPEPKIPGGFLLLPGLGFPGRYMKNQFSAAPQLKGYAPSMVAKFYNIKGKVKNTKGLSGFEIRPESRQKGFKRIFSGGL